MIYNDMIGTSALSPGFHTFYFRVKDSNGKWSVPQCKPFYKPTVDNFVYLIENIEYWVDNDFDTRTISSQSPQSTMSLLQQVDMSALTAGFHIFYFRVKDNSGKYSVPQRKPFYKPAVSVSDNNIVAYRYWFDNDINNVTNVALQMPVNPYELETAFEIPETFQYDEQHVFHIQFKDATGKWSMATTDTFRHVDNSISDTVAVTVCDGYNWKGLFLTESGTYMDTLGSVIKILKLTVNQSTSVTFEVTASNSYVWNGMEYTVSGTYIQYFTAFNSCDSVVTLNLTLTVDSTVYGCKDFKALNYNPNAAVYDTSCVYAAEENTFNGEVEGTPVDTVGTKPIEDCQIKTDLKIVDVKITKVDVIGTNQVKVYWEIKMENDTIITYPAVYTVSQSGVTLFYLSIICKEGDTPKPSIKSGGVTGFTVSASAMVDLKGSGVEEITNYESPITVYPNPTNEILYFSNKTAFEIIDIQGKVLLKNENAVKFVNVSHLQSGIYFININHQIQKIIKR